MLHKTAQNIYKYYISEMEDLILRLGIVIEALPNVL